jgi:hypothetical protein
VKKVLFEDVMNYNKWVSGIASRDLAAQKVTLKDLFDRTNTSQHPNYSKASIPMPYPLPSVIEQLGELYMNATNSISIFKLALKNPLIQQSDEGRQKVVEVIKKLQHIVKVIESIYSNTSVPVVKKPVDKDKT